MDNDRITKKGQILKVGGKSKFGDSDVELMKVVTEVGDEFREDLMKFLLAQSVTNKHKIEHFSLK